MITTQLKKLDSILGGGIRNAIITDIFGENGTGKTQLALQASLEPLGQNLDVLFIDTTGEFRPERILEIVKNRNMKDSLLDNLKIARATNTTEQINFLEKIKNFKNLSLVIIDNIADLFSFEYSKKEQSFEKNISFMKYMHTLSIIAIEMKIPIIITNTVRSINKYEKENLEESISMYIHNKIRLSKNGNGYSCQASSPFDNKKFQYTIMSKGLTDQS